MTPKAEKPGSTAPDCGGKLASPPVPWNLFKRVIAPLPEYRQYLAHPRPSGGLADLLAVPADQPLKVKDVFARLRWGGLVVLNSLRRRRVRRLVQDFRDCGFDIEKPLASVPEWRLPWPRRHYFVARKLQLIPPGEVTDRFTYQVQLVRDGRFGNDLVVLKQVPSFDSVVQRLRRKFPEVASEVLDRRARKFVDKVFPTFLTHEAGILRVLEEHLPAPYNQRVPRAIHYEQDERGMVRRLWMTWLRNGGRRLSQMEFAHQSADLLRAIHDIARVIHLDLRLDNFVITEKGVGFVDFGSAVREGESFVTNPLLSGLFEELMRTSQIQRMLYQMSMSGHITSDVILQSHHKADKAIDFFYLAVQFNCPHSNPDLVDLIQYDPESKDARILSRLTAQILRPADPAHPEFRSAKDILDRIERIQLGLDRRYCS